MSKFIAIDVNQGDAFYLKKDNFHVLVDGGRSKNNFPMHFENVVKRKSVDVVICTHNDADHANGILGFMKSHLTCKEVWLPGSWTSRLKDLIDNPQEFSKELYYEIFGLDIVANKIDEVNYEKGENSYYADSHEFNTIFENIDESTNKMLYPLNSDFFPDFFLAMSFTDDKFLLFIDALSQAYRIREIAIAAYNKGAQLRWFEYDQNNNSGGKKGYLEPVNSKEIFCISKYKPSALEYLTLTKANKESLVFVSPANSEFPGVLFSADSDFNFNQLINWSNGMIVTTPHHGSESNKNIYDRFNKETDSKLLVNWIRSDCKSRKRPGTSLLKVKGKKFCTLCKNSKTIKKPIILTIKTNVWNASSRTRSCSCI